MKKMFSPAIRIPGAYREPVRDPVTDEVIGTKWVKPPHDSVAVHFVNAAAKLLFAKGELSAKDATSRKAVYKGIDNVSYRKLRNDMKYAAKINSEEWKAKAAEIKGRLDTSESKRL